VALKFLPEAVTHNEHALERFRNEVRIARQVSHPNVCRVYDLGEMEGCITCRWNTSTGRSGFAAAAHRPASRRQGVRNLPKTLRGLAAAHEKGVLHRDLKPANIMLDARGQVRLTDFGLAGLAGEIEGGEVRNGTPAYMAPEQLTGEEVTVRSDIYALGLVLYEIFTGKLPFDSQTVTDRIRAQRENTPGESVDARSGPGPRCRACDSPVPDSEARVTPRIRSRRRRRAAGGDPLAAALAVGRNSVSRDGRRRGRRRRPFDCVAIPLLLAVFVALP
jgi:serine/threonine-protein kinase